MKRLAGTLLVLSSLTLYSDYNMRHLSDLSGLSQEAVHYWMHEFQLIEDWNESSYSYYGVFSNLINTYQLKKGCEIGIASGGHSYDILKKTNVEKLYSVDPFSPSLYPDFAQRGVLELYFLRITARLEEFGNRVQFIRNYSLEAVELFQDNELDFVFIDADHSYEAAKADIEAWYKKIRPGGIIAGDDYATKWPGVPQAVNEFAGLHKLDVHADPKEPRIWWLHKPVLPSRPAPKRVSKLS